jgi:trk system potassium uptake protein TrkA
MNILIVGLGKIGSYLASELSESGTHDITGVEQDAARAVIVERLTNIKVLVADGCEPSLLEEAGIRNADLVVAATGHDEDNLVISQLAKKHFAVSKVIARVNNPLNQWLYNPDWGVDVPVSQTDIITKLIEEEISIGDLVTLLKLKGGEVALTEITLEEGSGVVGQKLADIELPADSNIVVLMRGREIIVPCGETRLAAGDQLLAVTLVASEKELLEALK